MLANQVKVPDVQVPKEPARPREVKASRDDSSSRDFDRIMQNGRREQQDNNTRQQESRRQADAKEANTPNEQNVRAQDKPERTDNGKQHEDQVKDTDGKPVEAKEKQKQDGSEKNSEQVVNEEESQDTSSEQVASSAPATTEQELDNAEKSETSKWLDTILSIATGTDDSSKQATDVDGPKKPSASVEEKVSLLLVQQVLANNSSDADLSELEGQSEVTLSQLKSMLSEADYKAILAQLSSDTPVTEVSSEQEFEELLAQLAKGKSETTLEERATTKQPTIDLQTQVKQQNQEPSVTSAAQVVAADGETKKEAKATVVSLSQGEKLSLEKQDKFKQSSLMQAMQQASDSAEVTKEAVAPNTKSIAETLAPTTKVVDFGATSNTTVSTDKSTTATLSTPAGQPIVSDGKENQVSSAELDMMDVKVKDSGEIKLANLLGQLGAEEVKTSDTVNRAEKVNVGGVTLDKTLQMPKLENLSQTRNDVVVRENILFNKQELATQMQTQVGLMMARNMKSVDIRLDPPELGSMQVKLSVQNDQASVSFVVSSQQAKDALENSLPKLKELLEQQGLELADSDVNQQNSQNGAGEDDEQNGITKNGLNSDAEGVDDELEQQQQMLNRAINSPWNVSYYA